MPTEEKIKSLQARVSKLEDKFEQEHENIHTIELEFQKMSILMQESISKGFRESIKPVMSQYSKLEGSIKLLEEKVLELERKEERVAFQDKKERNKLIKNGIMAAIISFFMALILNNIVDLFM